MTDATPPAPGSQPAGNGSPKPGIDANHIAEEGKKVAMKAWEWTKKVAAYAWPRVKEGAKVVSEKVDKEMDKIIESVNHPQHQSPAPGANAPVSAGSHPQPQPQENMPEA